MEKDNQNRQMRYPLKNKMLLLVLVALVPLLCVTFYLIYALVDYSEAYDDIVSNMTIANSYNLNFKEEMDESLYKLVVSYVTFETIDEDPALKNPYELIEEMKSDFDKLIQITTDRDSRVWLQSLIRNLETLENCVDDIREGLQTNSQYDENIEMLDNNIYILTELIQDDIQYYIYYQTKGIESLKLQLNEQVNLFILFCITLVVLISILILIVAALIANSIIGPIRELCKVTGQIAEGDFRARAAVNTKDEIAVLTGSVNAMSENLEVMVNKIREDGRKIRRTELRLLQEQINPHFLYNTLDAIVWLIESSASEQAVNMVVSLSEFFRLVLSHGKEDITIKEEELHIRSYLEIQQTRYRDILEYEINIDPEIYNYKILKLTLQPLVENSLYHGIKYKRAMGKIWVEGKKEGDKLHLAVRDNGVGIEQQELHKLRLEIQKPCQETETGFGMSNVNERIRMIFGSEYGMSIDSVKGEGTCVSIIIPAVQISEIGRKGE